MASRDSDSSNKYQYLYGLDIEELENLLATDLKPDCNDEFIECVLEAMVKKEQDNPTGRIRPAEQAWSDFTNFYEKDGDDPEYIQNLLGSEDSDKEHNHLGNDNSHSTKVGFLRRTILVAAIVCVLITLLLPPALGYRNVVEMLGAWTEGQFYFVPDDGSSGSDLAPVETTLLNTEFPDLESALTASKISADILPTIILDNYTLEWVTVDHIAYSNTATLDAYYTNGNNSYLITCVKCDDNTGKVHIYEKTSEPVEQLTIDGTTYYLFSNINNIVAAWRSDTVECSITGNISFTELKRLINSI